MDNKTGFLQWILGDTEGYIAIGTRVARSGDWVETIFEYPSDLESVANHIQQYELTSDLYFCPTVLVEPKRVKANIKTSQVIWADLDDCTPDLMRIEPTVVLETSPKRYQAFWMLKAPAHALDVENINKRIAYAHADEGADRSGWDLTQYLRIPLTKNHKRLPEINDIKMSAKVELKYDLSDFEAYPQVEGAEVLEVPFPKTLPDKTGTEILESVKTSVHPKVWSFFETVPEKDWSKNLWQLELMLFNIEMTMEEVFIVCRDAACNKYARDRNSQVLLWKEVVRAHTHANNQTLLISEAAEDSEVFHIPDTDILSASERERADKYRTIIDDYIDWARSVGDAAPQYHVAGGFVILSCLLSGSVKLPTSYGMVLPNLWFMILADTTLTRKTTAMDMAMDIVTEIDSDAIMATDGSIEGLMGSIALRPNRPSVFLRDEFSGLLEMITKRDYYAGMLETFTKLYDGKMQKRVLRKEIIEIRDPVLIFFAGGIKERIYQLLSFDHINSGFIPRFCFITAESDINRIRPLGPPTESTVEEREDLVDRFRDIYHHYSGNEIVKDDVLFFKSWNASLTPEAWIRYNKIEATMTEIGLESSMPDLMTPMMVRLCSSGLKASVILAAAARLEDSVVVTEMDLIKAFSYVESWKTHAINVVVNAGKTSSEKLLERIYGMIQEHPGMKRSMIMQTHRLNARDADNIFNTLEQRGLIRAEKNRGLVYYPTNITTVKGKR